MHVATLLHAEMFHVALNGRTGSIADIFPDWRDHDRFGLVIDAPLGGLGATHLLQLAITGFYDCKPARRDDRRIYPEIYAMHVGRGFGAHADFDFWPARREVVIEGDHRSLLDAINDRGITRLAIPEHPGSSIVHRPKEVDAALDRITSVIVYSPTGRVSRPDFSIAGLDRKTEINPRKVLHPMPVTPEMAKRAKREGPLNKEIEPEWIEHLLRHQGDVSPAARGAAVAHRQAMAEGGLVTETYRFADVSEALYALPTGAGVCA